MLDDNDAFAEDRWALDHFPDACLLVGTDWTIAQANPVAERLLRLRRMSLRGALLFDVIPDDGVLRAACARAMAERSAVTLDRFLPQLESWFSVNVRPWRTGIAIFLRDVASEHRIAERVVESEAQLRDFLESATDLIHMLAPDGRVLYANRAWRETLGYSEEEVATLFVFDVVAPDSLDAARAALHACLTGEAPVNIQMVVLAKDGRRVTVRGSANCRLVDGVAVSTRGIYRDVTVEVEVGALLRSAKRTEASAIRAKTAFLNRASHELRTPLAAVIGFADILSQNRSGRLSPKEVTFAERIGSQGRNLLTLIEDVLSYAEIEARVLELEATTIDVAALLRDIVDVRVRDLTQSGPSVSVDAPASSRLETDAGTLRRIVRYLLDDAVRNGVDGAVTVRLVTDVSTGAARAIEVSGQPSHAAVGRTDTSHSDPVMGLELGLTVARSLSRLLGYGFVIETHEDGATTRRVELREFSRPDRRASDDMATTLHAFLDASPLPIIAFSPDWTVRIWSNAATRMFGWTSSDVVGTRLPVLPPNEEPAFRELLRQALLSSTGIADMPAMHVHRDGTAIDAHVSLAPLRTGDGQLRGFISIVADVSERKRLEGELRHAQKMEVVGRLAGGIAHDFNNLLTVILAHTEFLLADIPAPDDRRGDAVAIRDVANRAADLTRQLLLFARREEPVRRIVDLNVKLANVDRMLRRTLGSHIEFVTAPAPEPLLVYADPAQMEQLIMNMALNARDAMPDGGALVIETSVLRGGEGQAGEALLTISDTGVGMDDATRDRIFEPFFTTKEHGKGTGLGLASAHAIVNDAGGSIALETEVGVGTVFYIRLPLAGGAAEDRTAGLDAPADLHGSETVLIVDDQDAVRAVAARVLRAYGYDVLTARHGQDALRVVRGHETPIHLVVSDLVMPEMSGHDLASALRAVAPGVGILFISGYSETFEGGGALLHHAIPVLRKPFTGVELVTAVRLALDAR